jgi:tRNA (guanosine-2'-O-)-methyltransferase
MRPERFRRLRAVLARRQPDLTVLMEKVNKAHNFSAILRNCDAVGVLDAHVVPPGRGLELHHATSAGTRKWIRVHRHADVGSAVATLRRAGFRLVAAHPGEGARDYRAVDYTVPTAVMMGAELYGISPEGLALADERVSIPMAGMVHSLNVSVATALLLYEAMRQREAAGMYEGPRLSADAYRRTLFEWVHPLLAERLREEGRVYPPLDEDGAVLPDPGPGEPREPREPGEPPPPKPPSA